MRAAFVLCTILLAASQASSADTNQFADIYAITRGFIQSLVNDLENGANQANLVIARLLELSGTESSRFLTNLNSTLVNIQQDVQRAVTNAINNNAALGTAVLRCVANQTDNMNALLRATLNDITGCVTGTIANFGQITEDGRQLVQTAREAAANITRQTQACGVANFYNFLEVGRCLNRAYEYARTTTNAFILRLNTIGVIATNSITSAPLNLAACGTSKLADTALAAGQIVGNVTRCARDTMMA